MVVKHFRACLALTAALGFGACADGGDSRTSAATFGDSATDGESDGETEGDADSEQSSDSDDEAGVCIPQNCEDDLECAACNDGKTMCLADERRCVQCDPDSGEGCDDGEKCTEFGACVAADLECPTDDRGIPEIECDDDPDCGACDPDHQVCAAGRCVGCREDATDACASTEVCLGNECVAKCPDECTTNDECGNCGEEGREAHACHDRKCAECTNLGSTPVACPDGEYCTDQGVCVPVCGIPGQAPGTCEEDSDCAGCEGDNDSCHSPINGGHGVCGPSASGCSDLGEGVVVLPEPFDEVTNLCSGDGDCAGIGIQYNVGELLRELTGIDEIDDANINYPMNRCADVTVGNGDTSVSCGVCVPCQYDNDCEDIDVDEVASDAFGPLGGIATALLLDQLFGPNDHEIHMFCQPVAGNYGVCAPCPTLLSDCAGDGPTGNDDSCAGNCGGQAPSGCYCDDECVGYGDCCDDREAVCDGGGCAGHCGDQAPSGCYCDDGCAAFGDCCDDVEDVCGGGGLDPEESCVGNCGDQAESGCYCDDTCEDFGDCCEDYGAAC